MVQSEKRSINKRRIGKVKETKQKSVTVNQQAHNHGQSPHTSKYKPWNLITYLAFNEKDRALAFEKYLKSHSGKAFANKRLWWLQCKICDDQCPIFRNHITSDSRFNEYIPSKPFIGLGFFSCFE